MIRIVTVVASIAILAGIWYFFFYPPEVLKRHTQAALDSFSDAVAAQDRAKVGTALKNLIADGAKIRLTVNTAYSGNTDKQAENFSKADFATFVDNVLFSLTDYAYASSPRLTAFSLNPDHKKAVIVFSSKEGAEGTDWIAGTKFNMRYSSETTCHGDVRFTGQPQLEKIDCTIQLRMAPKPGQLY